MAICLTEFTARDLMSRHPITIYPQETVREALNLMNENGLSSLPVVGKDDACLGIISARDIMDWARQLESGLEELSNTNLFYADILIRQLEEDGNRQSVEELMTDSVVTVSESTDLPDVVSLMMKHQVHHLPVVDDRDRLIGILSTFDVLKAFQRSVSAAS